MVTTAKQKSNKKRPIFNFPIHPSLTLKLYPLLPRSTTELKRLFKAPKPVQTISEPRAPASAVASWVQVRGGFRERHLVTHAEQRDAGDKPGQREGTWRAGSRGAAPASAPTRGGGGRHHPSYLVPRASTWDCGAGRRNWSPSPGSRPGCSAPDPGVGAGVIKTEAQGDQGWYVRAGWSFFERTPECTFYCWLINLGRRVLARRPGSSQEPRAGP